MKNICILIFFFTASLSASTVNAQAIKNLKPRSYYSDNAFSKKEQQNWERVMRIYDETNDGKLSYETLSKADKSMIDSLENGYGPYTQGPGCSWYCGGGPEKITGDSALKGNSNADYKAGNIHDFNLFTAWVPDTSSGVAGKKINFHFEPRSARITSITIYNGYLKNIDLWRSNGRVKKLKMYLDGKPYAILELDDTTAGQIFEMEPVPAVKSSKSYVMTFEILEVYPGSKYKEAAITEINFDGLDVH